MRSLVGALHVMHACTQRGRRGRCARVGAAACPHVGGVEARGEGEGEGSEAAVMEAATAAAAAARTGEATAAAGTATMAAVMAAAMEAATWWRQCLCHWQRRRR